VLTPEPDLLIIPVETSRTNALIEIKKRRLSRIPVYKGETDNVIGILHSKDLLNNKSEDISSILHEPYFVPDKKNVFELLQEFQVKKTHIAVVLDEYGRLEGIVTLEDILEEIFGQIENEREVDMNLIDYRKGILEIGGGLRINDFNESCLYTALRSGGLKALGEEISKSLIPEDLDIETVGGYIFTNIGRLPIEGESITNGNIKLIVLKVENNRITRIKVVRFKN
jgi:putative hemolysin